MTTLTAQLREALELQTRLALVDWQRGDEHSRLTPIHEAMLKAIEALELIKDTPGLGGLDHTSTKKWRESSMAIIDKIAQEALAELRALVSPNGSKP